MANFTVSTKIKLTAKGKTYAPKQSATHQHHINWAVLTKALKGGKAKTYGSLCGLKVPTAVQHNHAPYIRYCVKSGWLAVVA